MGLRMASVLSNISNIIIPVILFYIVAYGISNRCNVYEDFIRGAKDGFHTVIQIMPTLIGLMVAVGVLRASGFLEFVGGLFVGVADRLGFSSELVPLMLVKMFSSSAATGLVLDIFKNHGPDSLIGLTTSIMMSCTETIFYTMSVYFLAAKVTKTRHTLKGALLATLAGIAASIVLAGRMLA
jgi:spore maturation protein B